MTVKPLISFSAKLGGGLLLLVCCVGKPAWAQQDKMFSQYMFNMMALNPAYAGSREVVSMTALYRNQWTGVQGAPQTATFTIDAPLNQDRIGLGLQLYSDKVGVFQETGAFASYAFRIPLSDRTTLALGLQAGAAGYQANLAQVQLGPGGSGQTDQNFASNVSKMLPNFGTGLYLSSDRAYVSLSVPRLIKNRLSDYNNTGDLRSTQVRQAYLGAGFVIELSPTVKMKPSTLVRYAEGTNLGVDGNVNFWFADRIAIGLSARKNQFSSWSTYSTDALVVLLEVQLTDQLRFGYAYDHTMNNFRNVAPSSHEFMLRYELGGVKTRIRSPRYL